MKNAFTHIFLLLITLLLAFSLFSCRKKEEPACPEHLDTTGDGLCEMCGAAAETKLDTSDTDIVLIEDGEFKFRVVTASDANSGTRLALNDLNKKLKKMGTTLEVVEDTKETIKDDGVTEVLIGTVTSRGKEYTIDPHTLGLQGYVVKIINGNIVIQAGSGSVLEEAFAYFLEDILGFDEDADELSDAVMREKDQDEYIQNDYDITSISIDGVEINGYTIAVDSTDKFFAPFAQKLQTTLYELAGYWLPIVSLDEAGDNSIILAVKEKDSTPSDSFRIYTKRDVLYIESEYANCVTKETELFLAKYITSKSGDINFSGKIVESDHSIVRYEDFGAKGDGITNDFAAIKAAHDYANDGGQRVLGRSTSTYYISKTEGQSIIIKTPTDWQGAHFIIDDTDLHETTTKAEVLASIIRVESYTGTGTINQTKIDEINAGEKLGPHTKKLDLDLGFRAVVDIINSNHKVYIRYGGGLSNLGSNQHEVVVIDAEGNIESGTELLLDYDKVTSINVYRCDDEYMEVKNATFTTKASRQDTTVGDTTYSTYFRRNLVVTRSNTTVLNVNHYVEGEFTVIEEQEQGLTGPSYFGFFSASNSENVTFKDCVMTGRRYYKISGTYGFSADNVNNIVLDHCTQSNFYKPGTETLSTVGSEYWGLGGTNFCKNMIYKDTTATRFDAHSGLYRGQIINCLIGMVNLIGGGEFLLENSTVCDSEFISLREDYGATWDGTIIIKDSILKNTRLEGRICSMLWTNHDFGYVCHFPEFIIDNVAHTNSKQFDLVVTEDSDDPNQDTISSWGDYIHIAGEKRDSYEKEELTGVTNTTNVNPLHPPKYLIVKNCPGILFRAPRKQFFSSTIIRGFDSYPAYDPAEEIPF